MYLEGMNYRRFLVDGPEKLSGLKEVEYRRYWDSPDYNLTSSSVYVAPVHWRSWNRYYLSPGTNLNSETHMLSRWRFLDLVLAFRDARLTVEKLVHSES